MPWRPPNHSVLIDWPWRYGFLVVSDDEVVEVIFVPGYGNQGEWETRLLARL